MAVSWLRYPALRPGGVGIHLTSSQPQALQVPSKIPIPNGQTRMPVDFISAAGGRGLVELRAMASGHLEGTA